MKILTAIKLLTNGTYKGCSRQAIKAQIAKSYGKEIANHVFNNAINFAMEIGLVKNGSTKSRFKLTPDGRDFLSPPKPKKKTTKKAVKKRMTLKKRRKKTAKKNSTKKPRKTRKTYKKVQKVTKKRKSNKKKAVKKKKKSGGS